MACGWRFVLIIGVIILNVTLAYRATLGNRSDVSTITIALWCLVVLVSIGLIPWTFLAQRLRYRHWTNAKALTLADTAKNLCTLSELSSELDRADYESESGWTAWHPKNDFFESAEGKKLWSGAVPVVYASPEFPRTVVIPFDWQSFYVWGGRPSFVHAGEFLPFAGPGDTRFRAGSKVRQLQAARDCWIVEAELEMPDETEDA